LTADEEFPGERRVLIISVTKIHERTLSRFVECHAEIHQQFRADGLAPGGYCFNDALNKTIPPL